MHTEDTRKIARNLRKSGLTHREIAKQLHISASSAAEWTKKIVLSPEQKEAIEQRRNRHLLTQKERLVITKRLKPYQYKNIYSDEDLIKKIKEFYMKHNRIPLKREFNSFRIFRDRFGSWNKAISSAGFDSNPVLFAKKFIAKDGHLCDSFTEKIIDDWFFEQSIPHKRRVPYRGTKMTADFYLEPNIILEFFGLAGVQKKYDELLKRKREICKKEKIKLIEIYPHHLFPKNKLSELLNSHKLF